MDIRDVVPDQLSAEIVDPSPWADALLRAEETHTAIAPITDTTELTIEDGYAIQDEIISRKVAAGQRIIGAKLGLTSTAKQQQMHVDEPVYGVLLSAGVHPVEAPLLTGDLIHPRVEPEIVFQLGSDLGGPGITAADVIDATVSVGCGLEIIDSRYTDFRFTAADVVADNTSAARIVLGPTRVPPSGLDLSLVGLLVEQDGALVSTAAGAATMGHPAEAVAMLANFLGARGRLLRAGWLIYSGGLTNALTLSPGSHVRASFGHLGSVGIRAV